ncbi:MAG: hypothetical protein ACTSR8_05360 [Promethearchaeota archaeon]
MTRSLIVGIPKVLGDPLFRDNNHVYSELKFAYNSYYYTIYYEPDPLLAEYLERLQYFIDNRKQYQKKAKLRRKAQLVIMGLFLIFLKKFYSYRLPF